MMKKIMILGAGILQVPAILTAKKMGLYVIAVDMDKDAAGFKYADEYAVISTVDVPAIIRCAELCGIDGILTIASDRPVPAVAAVTNKMGLTGIDELTALRATNKALMRDALRDHAVPIPAYFKAGSYGEFQDAICRFSGCCIVKPADNSGSRGVVLINNTTDKGLVDRAFAYSKSASHCGDILVEAYMTGHEVSVETLSIDGTVHVIAITDKLTTGAPYFVEMGHSQPSQLPAETQDRIVAITKDAVCAIGVHDGPAHTEIIVTSDGPKIVELGARLGGDNITTHLVPLSTGVDMVGCSIMIALGERPEINKTQNLGSAVRFFTAPPGVITGITGAEQAKRVKGIISISFNKEIGDEVREITSSADRIGCVVAQSFDTRSAIGVCEDAIKRITIHVSALPNDTSA